jgi:hypothetical protein
MDFEKMEQNGNLTRRKKGGLITLPFIFGKLQNNFFFKVMFGLMIKLSRSLSICLVERKESGKKNYGNQ